MSGRTKTPAGTTSDHAPVRTLPPAETPGTRLAPDALYPTQLAELDLTRLQVLHSRICRQLDQEYRTNLDGPHPVTLDRAQELAEELDTRQMFLVPPSHATPAAVSHAPGAEVPVGPETTQHAEHLDALFRFRGQSIRDAGARIQDLHHLRAGQQVEVWRQGNLHRVGRVDQNAPDLGVVWIRDALDGYRHMVHAPEDELRYHLPYASRGSHPPHPS